MAAAARWHEGENVEAFRLLAAIQDQVSAQQHVVGKPEPAS